MNEDFGLQFIIGHSSFVSARFLAEVIEKNSGRHRDIERIGSQVHRNRDSSVAGGNRGGAQALRFSTK